jgi:hypothetical protein
MMSGDHSSSSSSSGSASPSSFASFFKKDKWENQRVDRQYVRILGIVTVRVASQGFLWLGSSTTKLSDINQSVEEKSVSSMKSMKLLELYCNVVNDIYEISLETIDKMFIFVDCREVCYDIIEHDIVNSNSEIKAMLSATIPLKVAVVKRGERIFFVIFNFNFLITSSNYGKFAFTESFSGCLL